MQSSFSKIVNTKPKSEDTWESKKDKQSAKLRKQQREAKRDGGVLPDLED